MDVFFQVWDRIELWLVTLPFVLQLSCVLLLSAPLFYLAAVGVERIANVSVTVVRTLFGRQLLSTREHEVH